MNMNWIIFLCILLPLFTFSQTRQRVHRVKIVGNKMIADSAIQSQLKIKKGMIYKKSFVVEDVQKLFDMGYFSNIVVKSQKTQKGLLITYKIEEKPRIDSIVYKGNKILSSKKLEELSLLKKYKFLNIQKLKQGIQNIKKGYQDKGYFLTEVSYKVRKTKSSDKVQLEINIQEHEKTLIKKISFVGNYNISSKKIKTFLANKERNILSFLTNSSVYTEEKLKRDMQVIRFLYMEEGYLEMKMGEPQVSLSPNKDGLYISFSISEGESFTVGQVDYAGDLIFQKWS